jgi:hypothetical protein
VITLALAVAAERPSLCLDLESPSDRAKLDDAVIAGAVVGLAGFAVGLARAARG